MLTLPKPSPADRRAVPLDAIVSEVCVLYAIKRDALMKSRVTMSRREPFGVLCLLLREHTRLTFEEIGLALGGRDHTTVIHHVENAKLLIARHAEARARHAYLTNRIDGANQL